MKSVFVSYSHQDNERLEELRLFLKPLERILSLEAWIDTRIKMGDDWKAGIDEALAQANIALALVTQAFLASDFIAKKELPYLLEKHKEGGLTLIPIFFEPSNVGIVAPELVQLQGCGSPDKPLSKLGKAERQERLVALSQRLAELAKPAKPIDLVKEPHQELRDYALSVHVDRQGEQWVTQYRIPGQEPLLSTHHPWAAVWQPLQALLDVLVTGDREAVQGIIATANRYWGQVLFDALFGVDERQHETIFRAAFQQGQDRARPTPLRAGLRLRIASPLPEISHLPWRLAAWQGHSLARNGWVFISGQAADPVLDIHTTVPNNILVLDGLDEDGDHRRRLLQTVQAVWNDARDSLPYIRWPRTIGQLDKALAGISPHWIYVRGQIEGAADLLCG